MKGSASTQLLTKEQCATAWLFAYFRYIHLQPSPAPGETLHYAISYDGLHWQPLNQNQPVLEVIANGQSGSIRDPFIGQGFEGQYYLLATNSSWGWDSPCIFYASSEDLINWHHMRLVSITEQIPGAKNAWAPEFVADPVRKDYFVYWTTSTSSTYLVDKCIWYSRTVDFQTFTKPGVLFDPGLNVIDAHIQENNGTYYLFFKPDTLDATKCVRIATARNLKGPYTIMTDGITSVVTEGPQLMHRPDLGRWYLYYDYAYENRYGVSTSTDLLNWDKVEDISFPPDARHGSILSLSGEQVRLLTDFWQR